MKRAGGYVGIHFGGALNDAAGWSEKKRERRTCGMLLLGHADVRTTMIYTHCVPSKTIKEVKSPLDF